MPFKPIVPVSQARRNRFTPIHSDSAASHLFQYPGNLFSPFHIRAILIRRDSQALCLLQKLLGDRFNLLAAVGIGDQRKDQRTPHDRHNKGEDPPQDSEKPLHFLILNSPFSILNPEGSFPHVDLPRPGDLGLGRLFELDPLGHPSHGPADDEDRSEHGAGQPQTIILAFISSTPTLW